MNRFKLHSTFIACVLPVFGACLASTAFAQNPSGKTTQEQALPARKVVIDINAPARTLYSMAVPNLIGDATLGEQGAEVIRNDFRLSSVCSVVDPKSYLADPKAEGLNIFIGAWSAVGAQGVIKGEVKSTGDGVQIQMRLYELAKGTTPTLTRSYQGKASALRSFMHEFASEVLRVLTGERGAFDTRIAFARRVAPGRKDVFVADYDGFSLARASKGQGVAMLPGFVSGGVWYSVLTKQGMYITRAGGDDKPAIPGGGLNMGVTECGGRVLFTSTRDGNSEIYSASTDGSDLKRLTNHPGIDVSPACGLNGQIAFVSDRHGSPQVFIMDGAGGNIRRITYRGKYNQTPSWCQKPDTPLIAFSGRDEGFDIFTVNLKTGDYKRLTQGQGSNKDPAFSPDCRMIAFSSSRGGGGVYVMNPDGLNQTLIIPGAAETVRWSPVTKR
jgi:TolB protein